MFSSQKKQKSIKIKCTKSLMKIYGSVNVQKNIVEETK